LKSATELHELRIITEIESKKKIFFIAKFGKRDKSLFHLLKQAYYQLMLQSYNFFSAHIVKSSLFLLKNKKDLIILHVISVLWL